MRKIVIGVIGALMLSFIASCEGEKKAQKVDQDATVVTDTIVEDTIEKKQEEAKQVKKKTEKKKEEPVKVAQEETPKVEGIPDIIGGSPDAVYSLEDNETESTPKFTESDKALKKLLKSKLRKAKKGEKATFRVSMVIKSDGTVGRVQFSSCGYVDEYKPEIVEALQSLPEFIPGTKDGQAVDSWYYLTWKR